MTVQPPGVLPQPSALATLPVRVHIRDACWAFDVILEPRRAPAGQAAGLPPELVIVGAADGLGVAGTAIADALRTAGMTASSVRFRGVVNDFVPLNALPTERA